MGTYQLRLGSTVSFDEDKEKDIIQKVELLASRHKLGEFISNLLKVALDSPNKEISTQLLAKGFNEIASSGLTKERDSYFNTVNKELYSLKKRLDEVYEMNLKLLSLAQMGKQLNIEEKTDNSLRGQFILEKQVNDLCETLGVEHMNHVYESNKLLNTKEKASDIMEYLINTYDEIFKEMKDTRVKEISNKVVVSAFNSNSNDEIIELAEPLKETALSSNIIDTKIDEEKEKELNRQAEERIKQEEEEKRKKEDKRRREEELDRQIAEMIAAKKKLEEEEEKEKEEEKEVSFEDADISALTSFFAGL